MLLTIPLRCVSHRGRGPTMVWVGQLSERWDGGAVCCRKAGTSGNLRQV